MIYLDNAMTSVLEHNSISRPLNQLEKNGMITLTRLPDDVRQTAQAMNETAAG
jgi:hypothetical protein